MSRPARAPLVAAGVLAVVWCCASLEWMGRAGWPPLHTDSILYVTPAVNLANGRGLSYSAYVPAFLRKGDWHYDFHGQLAAVVLARLTPGGDLPDFARTLAWLNIATVLAGFVYFAAALSRAAEWSLPAAVFGGAVGGLALAPVLCYLQGRPEHVIPLVLCVAGLARLWLPGPRYALAIDALELGTVGLASPAPGVILACFRAASYLADAGPDGRPLVRVILLATVAAAWWAVLAACLSPYPPLTLLRNTIQASVAPSKDAPRGLSILHKIWLFNMELPLLGAPFLVAAGELARRALVVPTAGRRVLAVGSLGFLGAAVFFLSVLYYPQKYNLACLLPLAMLWGVELLGRPHRAAWWWRTATGVLLGVAVVVLGMSHLRNAVLLQAFADEEATFLKAREDVASLASSLAPNERIGTLNARHAGLVLLSPNHMPFVGLNDVAAPAVEKVEQALDIRIAYLLYDLGPEPPPPQLGPFRLVRQRGTWSTPRWGPLPIGDKTPGYHFAVYRRDGP